MFSQDLIHLLPHLSGRLVGERERQSRGVPVALKKPGHHEREYGALAGTGACKHQNRSVEPLRGFTLLSLSCSAVIN